MRHVVLVILCSCLVTCGGGDETDRAKSSRGTPGSAQAAPVGDSSLDSVPGSPGENRMPERQEDPAARTSASHDSVEDAIRKEENQSEIDHLRSLPYLTFSGDKAVDGTDGVMVWDRDRAWPGVNLYTIRALCIAKLIDMEGRVVRAWRHKPCERWARSELLPNGDLWVIGRESYRDRVLLRFNWDGDLVSRLELPVHHDVEIAPDGNVLVLQLDPREADLGRGMERVRDDRIVLLSENGRTLGSLSLFDALQSKRVLQEVRARQDGAIDLLHANSIEWMTRRPLFDRHEIYDARHVLVSIRHQDLIAIVDWDTKELVWSWGQGTLSGPHDATLLESGNILVFDNGMGRGWSRVVEVNPLENRIVWEFRGLDDQRFFTRGLGSAQRLPNGNTLIANSESGEAFEVTPEGETVWDYYTPQKNREGHRATIVRMKRYDPEWVSPLTQSRRGISP